jgi:hypothetical protein
MRMAGQRLKRLIRLCLALLLTASSFPQSKSPGPTPAALSLPEVLSYSVEWRLIYAGSAELRLGPVKSGDMTEWRSKVHLQSAGLVSKLYKLDDTYSAVLQDQFCATDTDLDSFESKKHKDTRVNYDRAQGKATYTEKDLLKNAIVKTDRIDTPSCVSDIIGALYKLRTLKLEPGQSAQMNVSDGKKFVNSRVEAQEREEVQTKAGTFKTIRYEAFLFNGVLYQRKAQLFIWLTDDARKLPVQIRARMSFPIGNITLQLDKEQHS